MCLLASLGFLFNSTMLLRSVLLRYKVRMRLLASPGFLFNFMRLFKFSSVTRYVCVYWLHLDFFLTSRGCLSSLVLQVRRCLLASPGSLFNFTRLFKFSSVTRYVCIYWLH